MIDKDVREGFAADIADLGAEEVTDIGEVRDPLDDLATGGERSDDGSDIIFGGLMDINAEEAGFGGGGIEGIEIREGGDAIYSQGCILDEGGRAFVGT